MVDIWAVANPRNAGVQARIMQVAHDMLGQTDWCKSREARVAAICVLAAALADEGIMQPQDIYSIGKRLISNSRAIAIAAGTAHRVFGD